MSEPFLAATNLQKRYGSTVAVDGVSLRIERGEIFGFIGPNGAGKTTTLSILAGLLDADSGEVRLDGQLFRRRDLDLRRRVGLGTQDLAVYPELTARENLLFFGKLYEIDTIKLAARTEQLLQAVGLSDRANDRAGTFSGGMKRRLNLAVAVVHEPDILFLDEPTTGVDPQSRNHIFELVKQLNAAGMTIIYTSHYMEEVQALCKRIAIIDHGQIKATNTLEELLNMLEAQLILHGVRTDEGVRAAFAAVPGIKSVRVVNDSVELVCHATGPVLPLVAGVCSKLDLKPRTMTVNDPTLEKVFLQLTGEALRN